MESVKFKWYKTSVSSAMWFNQYSHIAGYTNLGKQGKEIEVGFLAVHEPINCLEITNLDELKIIDRDRKSKNCYPFVFEIKEELKVQISEEAF
jgi:hypothetical protein